MIDTVVLRVHGIKKYRGILLTLDRARVTGYTTKIATIDEKEFYKISNQGNTVKQVLDIMQMNGTGEILAKTKYSQKTNVSSHYTFAYKADYINKFIEFNFSIPKYTYGSNVLMFVEHIGDRGFNFSDCSRLDYNIERAYDLLMGFLGQLFRLEFEAFVVDPKDVEIHRIDVCFNQVFRSKADALQMLEYQKRKRKKYARNEDGVMREYETSIMYVTKRYSAKIYHKGTEYAKNDRKEHEKINIKKKGRYFRTEEYQAFADKILRYELTIRHTMLNYLHKKNLFRKSCPQYRPIYKEYENVEAMLQKIERIAKRVAKLSEEEKEMYLKENPYPKISKESRKCHKYVSNLINSRTFFTLAVDEPTTIYNKQMVNYKCERALFSKKLLKLCLGKLVSFMEEFQVKALPPDGQIEKLIDEYNLRHKERLPKYEMMKFYDGLLRFGSFKESEKFNRHSRATMYRYKERFKKIGITENNLIPLTPDGIPEAELDLRQYHYVHQFESAHFLRKGNYLNMI